MKKQLFLTAISHPGKRYKYKCSPRLSFRPSLCFHLNNDLPEGSKSNQKLIGDNTPLHSEVNDTALLEIS